jgi:hypothetical protein
MGVFLYLYVMMNQSQILSLIGKLSETKSALEKYRELRQMFVDAGVKQWQLSKGENMTQQMYMKREEMIDLFLKINQKLRKYGIYDENNVNVNLYLKEFFGKIDEETPLE